MTCTELEHRNLHAHARTVNIVHRRREIRLIDTVSPVCDASELRGGWQRRYQSGEYPPAVSIYFLLPGTARQHDWTGKLFIPRTQQTHCDLLIVLPAV